MMPVVDFLTGGRAGDYYWGFASAQTGLFSTHRAAWRESVRFNRTPAAGTRRTGSGFAWQQRTAELCWNAAGLREGSGWRSPTKG